MNEDEEDQVRGWADDDASRNSLRRRLVGGSALLAACNWGELGGPTPPTRPT